MDVYLSKTAHWLTYINMPCIHDGEVILLCPDRTLQPGDEVWVEYADGATDLQVLVQLRDGEVVLDSVAGQRQRKIRRRSEIKNLHSLLAVFAGQTVSRSYTLR